MFRNDNATAKTLPVTAYLVWHSLLLLTCWAGSVNAGDRSAEGKAILHKHCGRCHAIEATGENPLETAPPMRDIYGRYATRELRRNCWKEWVSRHMEMPQISFSREDVAAIVSAIMSSGDIDML